jgi:FtsH-binding integral membrane protein
MRRLAAAVVRLVGMGLILSGAFAWAGLAYTESMEAVVSFALGFIFMAVGTALFLTESD